MESIWNEYMSIPCGIHRIFPFHMESMWNPWNISIPYGLYFIFHMEPNIFHMESMWIPWNICIPYGIHMEYLHSIWNPYGIFAFHMEYGGRVKYCKIVIPGLTEHHLDWFLNKLSTWGCFCPTWSNLPINSHYCSLHCPWELFPGWNFFKKGQEGFTHM